MWSKPTLRCDREEWSGKWEWSGDSVQKCFPSLKWNSNIKVSCNHLSDIHPDKCHLWNASCIWCGHLCASPAMDLLQVFVEYSMKKHKQTMHYERNTSVRCYNSLSLSQHSQIKLQCATALCWVWFPLMRWIKSSFQELIMPWNFSPHL